MLPLSLAQLRTLDALVSAGSLQAAAAALHRTHPTLHTSLRKMEEALGFQLFDRSGYRLELTEKGAAFLSRARRVLAEMNELQTYSAQMAAGAEAGLRVVIGDLSPLPTMLGLLRKFFAQHPQTQLHLQFEALSGPWELLLEDKVDLILHHVNEGEARFETIPLGRVSLIPVAAPGFLPFPPADATIERMRELTQCVIRDSARTPAERNYFVLEGARTCTVSDQMMKKEVILQGLGWGHMPDYLVAEELADGRLIAFSNRYFRGSVLELVAARKAGRPHGPTASKLWEALQAAAPPQTAESQHRAQSRQQEPRGSRQRHRSRSNG